MVGGWWDGGPAGGLTRKSKRLIVDSTQGRYHRFQLNTVSNQRIVGIWGTSRWAGNMRSHGFSLPPPLSLGLQHWQDFEVREHCLHLFFCFTVSSSNALMHVKHNLVLSRCTLVLNTHVDSLILQWKGGGGVEGRIVTLNTLCRSLIVCTLCLVHVLQSHK